MKKDLLQESDNGNVIFVDSATNTFTVEQERKVREIVRDEIKASVDIASINDAKTSVENAARQILTHSDQMQKIFANDQMERYRFEREVKAELQDAQRKIEESRKRTEEAIDRIEKGLEVEESERRAIRELIENLRIDVRDGQYRIGDAFVPVLGRNPMIPDATPVMPALRTRVETNEQNVAEIRSELSEIKCDVQAVKSHIDEQKKKREELDKWIAKAVPAWLMRLATTPGLTKGLIYIICLILSWLGFTEAAQMLGGQ